MVFIIASMTLFAETPRGKTSERDLFDAIKNMRDQGNAEETLRLTREYLALHPTSPRAFEVHLMAADSTTSPDNALRHYLAAAASPNLSLQAKARYRACEILLLTSQWKKLRETATQGTSSGMVQLKFAHMAIIASINLGLYDDAERECRRLLERDHDYQNLSRLLLYLAYIQKATTGHSRAFLETIRDIAVGYESSDAAPAAFYLLGVSYDSRGKRDEAYSAFLDLNQKYHGSPEAVESAERLKRLAKYRPRRVFYMPSESSIETADTIDIHPEEPIGNEEEDARQYTVSIGPFSTRDEAFQVKKMLHDDFGSVAVIRMSKGFNISVGKGVNKEEALKLRIRLAEEYGINGRILLVSRKGSRTFMYGE